jgi:hypothetical protein
MAYFYQSPSLDAEQTRRDNEKAKQKQMTIIWIVVVIVVTIILLVGIITIFLLYSNKPVSATPNTNATGIAPLGGVCATTANCSSSLVCSSNICKKTPQATCSKSSDCPTGYICFNGICKGTTLDTAVCTTDSDCISPLGCPNQVCTQLTCSTPTSTIDCPNGGVCTDNKICGGLLTQYCTNTMLCAEPYYCTTTNVCLQQTCATTNSCSNINNGVDGQCDTLAVPNSICVLNPNQSCIEDTQCDPNTNNGNATVCDNSGTSPSYRCKLKATGQCAQDSDCITDLCLANDHCGCYYDIDCSGSNGGATPLCDTTSNMCVGCITDNDCSNPNPFCGPSSRCVQCILDSDCPNGYTCVSNICVA